MRRITDFRNVAVHEYFSIEWSLVWAIGTGSPADATTPDHEGDQSGISGYR
ncbi:MAG: HepT-like ribonuclease domain-containing protein [Pseudonocardiaceae bacterium]